MKPRTLILSFAAMCFPLAVAANTMTADIDIYYLGDRGEVSGEVHYQFDSATTVNVSGVVSRNFEETHDEIEAYPFYVTLWDGNNDYAQHWYFSAPAAGGCYVGKIVAYDGFTLISEYSLPACFDPMQCNLSITVDSGGSLSTGGGGGYVGCYDCVTLTATPYNGWQFDGWTGSITSQSSVITVCMNGSDRFETAHFSEIPSSPPTPHGYEICPIILDLDGDGFATSGAEAAVSFFDTNYDGVREPSGWIAAGANDAFLWMDVNGNGEVDPGELFGSTMLLPDGTRAKNGFEALAMYDRPENGGQEDGVIDRHDAIWEHLLLWIDRDHDGRSNPHEIEPVGKEQILSLSLNPTHTHQIDSHGNALMLLKTYRRRIVGEGSRTQEVERALADIAFIPLR